jgi:hypothetical protein
MLLSLPHHTKIPFRFPFSTRCHSNQGACPTSALSQALLKQLCLRLALLHA